VRSEVTQGQIQESRAYEQAWSLMMNGQYEDALQAMTILYVENPECGLYEVMVNRLKTYIQTPPPDGWSGVFNLKNK